MIKNYFIFPINPSKYLYSQYQGNKLKTFIFVLLITHLLLLIVSYMLPVIQQDHVYSEAITNVISNAYILLIVPIFEELIFRLPLRVTATNFSTSISIFIVSIIISLLGLLFSFKLTLFEFYSLSILFSFPVIVITKYYIYSEKIEQLLKKNYNILFYIGFSSFISAHFYYVDFNITNILTYTIYGHSLCFLRVTVSFYSCILFHFILNFPVLLTML